MRPILGFGLVVLALSSNPARAARYQDPTYGFSFEQPVFPAIQPGQTVQAVSLAAPPVDRFSNNINVQVQAGSFTIEAYRDLSLKDFERMGWTLISQEQLTRSGRPAIRFDFQGLMGLHMLRWRSLAVLAEDRAYLITCTTRKDAFEAFEPACQQALDSFEIP